MFKHILSFLQQLGTVSVFKSYFLLLLPTTLLAGEKTSWERSWLSWCSTPQVKSTLALTIAPSLCRQRKWVTTTLWRWNWDWGLLCRAIREVLCPLWSEMCCKSQLPWPEGSFRAWLKPSTTPLSRTPQLSKPCLVIIHAAVAVRGVGVALILFL